MHHDRLKSCVDRVLPLWVRQKRNEILHGVDANDDASGVVVDDDYGLDSLFQNMDEEIHEVPASKCSTNPIVSDSDQSVQDKLTLVKNNSMVKSTEEVPRETRSGRTVRPPRYMQDYYY